MLLVLTAFTQLLEDAGSDGEPGLEDGFVVSQLNDVLVFALRLDVDGGGP